MAAVLAITQERYVLRFVMIKNTRFVFQNKMKKNWPCNKRMSNSAVFVF